MIYRIRLVCVAVCPFRSPCSLPTVFSGNSFLETGFPDRADIRWIRYPSRELVLYTGSPDVDFWGYYYPVVSVDKDSTSCIFAVVRSPQRTIMSTTWYMQVPLLIAFLFVSLCVFFQIRMLGTASVGAVSEGLYLLHDT